ncbi:MAG: SGNH/GDSL hydrolase family protein [Flavobacteriales bacterium]|nr:SGNH/GDSL hydrolase family protein [Flavobacteriales bacterium]
MASAEVVLRKMGWLPGITIYSKWFSPVDSLMQFRGYSLDDAGVFVVDTAVVSELFSDTEFMKLPQNYVGTYAKQIGVSGEVAALVRHHADLCTDAGLRDSLLLVLNGNTHHFSFQHYLNHPINKHGFYSIDHSDSCTGKARVMLIGDSFVWGHSASHPLKSFSNRLLLNGYCVYNFGVSGADVPQYQAIVNEYASMVDPDIIIVNYYLGNDLQFFDRQVLSTVPIFYATNAGNLYGYRNGKVFFDQQQAYDAIMDCSYVPKEPWYAALLGKLSITTLIWKVVTQFSDWRKHVSLLYFDEQVPESTKNMEVLVETASSLGYPVKVVVIPELAGETLRYYDDRPHFFYGLDVYKPLLTIKDYNIDDGHFNDEGHEAYSDYLQNIIDSTVQNSPLND